jgi:hypothetical protein
MSTKKTTAAWETSERRAEAREANRDFPWMPLARAEEWLPYADCWGVSKVARSKGQFFDQYTKAGGDWRKMPVYWQKKRANFCRRHLRQVETKGEAIFFPDGTPTRRHLALVMWAFTPEPRKLRRAFAEGHRPA